jgi:hypothetical protein
MKTAQLIAMIFIVLFSDYISSALAMSPATEREVICSNSYIFVATVISAARSLIQCAGIGVSGVYCDKGNCRLVLLICP